MTGALPGNDSERIGDVVSPSSGVRETRVYLAICTHLIDPANYARFVQFLLFLVLYFKQHFQKM